MTEPDRGSGTPNDKNKAIRCAVYCRKSTDENLDSAFNSLDAQREACLNYIASQKHAGWLPYPEPFEDGGFSGGTLERPALKRLIAAVQAGEVKCVVVYRADRLSRRIIDFLQLVELFDQHGVAFVSVTEQFNTATPGGRLYQHMLLSFAQYERELIAERTRHKVHAARRKGKFTGGTLILGYDCDPKGGRLLVNEAEAKRVREVFRLFIEQPSPASLAAELNRRGWTLKRWRTRKGRIVGGGAFTKFTLKRLLTNHTYIGKVCFGGVVYDGEHDPIVDQQTWTRVQKFLKSDPRIQHRRSSCSPALLAGILHCAPCSAAMTPTFSQKGRVRYRYYVCNKAHRRGWATCPSKSVPAVEIEKFVVDQIRTLGRNPDLVTGVLERSRSRILSLKSSLESEAQRLRKHLERAHNKLRQGIREVSATPHRGRQSNGQGAAEDIPRVEERLKDVRHELAMFREIHINPDDLIDLLRKFDPLWERMSSTLRRRIVRTLIERIDYDGGAGKLSMGLRPMGVRLLRSEPVEGMQA